LQEKIIEITGFTPVDLFGINDQNLNLIRKYFPKLKLITRGNIIKVIGEPEVIEQFEKKYDQLVRHLLQFNSLSESTIENIMTHEEDPTASFDPKEAIVHGNGGFAIKAKTPNQRKLVKACLENDMVFVIGPAGTGKTYTAVAMAVRSLKNKEVRRIVLTRPAVEAGENLGFLPGDLKEKLDPYVQPLYDALRDMIPSEKLTAYIDDGILEIAPLAFMRGRTLDKAFVILDEAQNTTMAQMKMFLTRMGRDAKFIITGDISQIDLPKNQTSGLVIAAKSLAHIKGIAVVELDASDIVRHPLIKEILNAFKDV